MKTRLLLTLAAALSTITANAQLYRENFNLPMGLNYNPVVTAWASVSPFGPVVLPQAGLVPNFVGDPPYVNNLVAPGPVGGQLAILAPVPGPVAFFAEEGPDYVPGTIPGALPYAAINFGVRLNHAPAAAGLPTRFIMRIGANWYASNPFFDPTPGVAPISTVVYNVGAGPWMTVNPVTLAVGPVVALPMPALPITAVGLMADIGAPSQAWDRFEVF